MEGKVVFTVFRYDPSTGGKPKYVSYEVPYRRGMTVLDGLLYIKERIDHTLAIRYSCRMGICGSCGMKVNGLPRLACFTQVSELGRRYSRICSEAMTGTGGSSRSWAATSSSTT